MWSRTFPRLHFTYWQDVYSLPRASTAWIMRIETHSVWRRLILYWICSNALHFYFYMHSIDSANISHQKHAWKIYVLGSDQQDHKAYIS